MINTPRTSLIKYAKMKVWPIESSVYTEGEFVGGNDRDILFSMRIFTRVERDIQSLINCK